MIVRSNYSLLNHNTFGLGVSCDSFYQFETKEDLQELYQKGLFESKWLTIGGGSNLLLMEDLDYPVLRSAMKKIEKLSETDCSVVVKAEAGVVWDDFVAYAVENNYGGVENLSYIPGSVGASPVQNVGAYGVEAKDVIDRVEVFDTRNGSFAFLDAADCAFGYRDSLFKHQPHYIVVSVEYNLSKMPFYEMKLDYGNVREEVEKSGEVTLSSMRKAIVSIRKKKLPEVTEIGSAGSFFKNPVVGADKYISLKSEYEEMPSYDLGHGEYKIPAAWLISQCGWKGKTMGKAGVYEKQPLILINTGGAKGDDVVRLMNSIQTSVQDRFGISLHPEVCIITN